MFALLRATSVTAVLGLSFSLPTSAEAQWFGWGWGGWGWDEPAYTTYYPGSYGGWYGYGASYAPASYGGYYAPGGCGCAPSCGCDPCGCNPCGCNPCGCNPCGSACGTGNCSGGNCQGGNCSYDAPAGGAPVPDPNVDAPPVRPRTTPRTTPSRTTPDAADDAPPFESPMRPDETPIERTPPRSRTSPLDEQRERFQPRTRGTDPGTGAEDPFGAANPDTPRGTGGIRDNSTAPAGGTNRTRPGTGNDGLLDPALDKTFGTQKPPLPDDTGTVIQPRGPAKGTEVKDGTEADIQGPRLDLKSTSAPVVLKTRLAAQQRASSLSQTAGKPVVRDWSAAMTEPRRLR